MTLQLVGLEPGRRLHYSWVGDGQCDRERSDFARWLREGEGLVPVEGGALTELVCEALRPTTLEIVREHAWAGLPIEPSTVPVDARDLLRRNWPAVLRAAIAYSVVEVKNGPQPSRVADAGGLRLSDDFLDQLALLRPVKVNGEELRLFQHLGHLLMRMNTASDDEGKG